jgi:hypothetical protein
MKNDILGGTVAATDGEYDYFAANNGAGQPAYSCLNNRPRLTLKPHIQNFQSR